MWKGSCGCWRRRILPVEWACSAPLVLLREELSSCSRGRDASKSARVVRDRGSRLRGGRVAQGIGIRIGTGIGYAAIGGACVGCAGIVGVGSGATWEGGQEETERKSSHALMCPRAAGPITFANMSLRGAARFTQRSLVTLNSSTTKRSTSVGDCSDHAMIRVGEG